MRFHRTPKTQPALLAVVLASLTSFPAHDLGAGIAQIPQALQAEKLNGEGGGNRTFHSRELRSLLLPFAAPLLSHNYLAPT